MSLKKTLQRVGEWVESVAKLGGGIVTTRVSAGPLKDSLKELGELGGSVGAVFKIASWIIPEPTPEQLIATTLLKTFLDSVEKAIAANPDLCTSDEWQLYVRGSGQAAAEERLSQEFSWLSILGGRGQRPSRSWPLVADLADIAETWFAGAALAHQSRIDEASQPGQSSTQRPLTPEARQAVQIIRGTIADALAAAVESLLQQPAIRDDWEKNRLSANRVALDLLAEEISTLDRTRLFGEVPQSALYIPPSIQCVDFRQRTDAKVDWDKIPVQEGWKDVSSQIQPGTPKLIVIHGEMGAGKSCLMRVLAAEAARLYCNDKNLAPVFVRWREIYTEQKLLPAIAERLSLEYQLPFDALPGQDRVVYFVDGFDEMSSHDPTTIFQLFGRLADLVKLHRVTVVVAMRSTVVTPNIEQDWFDRQAFVVRVQPFSDREVDGWAVLWLKWTGDIDVTGDRMRSLADKDVTHNPLLLYMLARYVHPVSTTDEPLSRADVFRTFVDETITGKLRAGSERFPFGVEFADTYRLLLQEMAYLASWPASNGKCKELNLAEVMEAAGHDSLTFKDVRTAFVLHFFDPGTAGRGEFEFQPEGFRQYLLAEWSARTQWEAHQGEEDFRKAPFRRTRDQAQNALAQLPLQKAERDLLDDLFTGFGRLVTSANPSPTTIANRFKCLGIAIERDQARSRLDQLLRRQWNHIVTPPSRNWLRESRVGVPEGQTVPDALDQTRLLVNYWDQCLTGYLALARGLSTNTPITPPGEGELPLGRFMRLQNAVRGHSWKAHLNLSRHARISHDLQLLGFQMTNLRGANLRGANLRGANLSEANLSVANLAGADLSGANLSGANLSGADHTQANLTRADLSGANLSGADLTRANLSGADLTGATLTADQLKSTRGKPAFVDVPLPPQTDPPVDEDPPSSSKTSRTES